MKIRDKEGFISAVLNIPYQSYSDSEKACFLLLAEFVKRGFEFSIIFNKDTKFYQVTAFSYEDLYSTCLNGTDLKVAIVEEIYRFLHKRKELNRPI